MINYPYVDAFRTEAYSRLLNSMNEAFLSWDAQEVVCWDWRNDIVRCAYRSEPIWANPDFVPPF